MNNGFRINLYFLNKKYSIDCKTGLSAIKFLKQISGTHKNSSLIVWSHV